MSLSSVNKLKKAPKKLPDEIPNTPKVVPRNSLKSSIIDQPAPVKNEILEQVKNDISILEPGGNGVKYEVTEGMTLIELQKYISTITSNYSRKVGGIVKFTVRKIDDKSIGVWVTI